MLTTGSFCETCDKLLCLECIIKQHKGHECNLISEICEKYKTEILHSLKPIEERLKVTFTAMEELNTCNGKILEQQDNLEAEYANILDKSRMQLR